MADNSTPQPAGEDGAPERIWITRYADGSMSNIWLPTPRVHDPERDAQPLTSIPYTRATQPATAPELLSAIQNAQSVLAMILHSGDSRIPKDLVRSGESALAECTAVLFGRPASDFATPTDIAERARRAVETFRKSNSFVADWLTKEEAERLADIIRAEFGGES